MITVINLTSIYTLTIFINDQSNFYFHKKNLHQFNFYVRQNYFQPLLNYKQELQWANNLDYWQFGKCWSNNLENVGKCEDQNANI